MIKFFRRIRRKLLDEGNLKRYLIYAIGEILLVMIGILLALQVTTLNENRKDKESEIQALKVIKDNLESEDERLDLIIESSKQSILMVENLISGKHDSIKFEQLFTDLTVDHIHQRFNSGYKSLVSTNSLELLTNQKLKNQLVNFYESYYDRLDGTASYERSFATTKMEPYLIKIIPIVPSKNEEINVIIQKLNNDVQFNNLLQMFLSLNKSKIRLMNESKNKMNEIKELIENELKK